MKNWAVKTDPGMTEPCRWEGTSGGHWSNACSKLVPLDQDAEKLVQLTSSISKDADPTFSGPCSSV